MAMSETVNEFIGAGAPNPLIEDIQRKADGSFVVTCNGYPYHATAQETPSVYRQIIADIAGGAQIRNYVEPATPDVDPKERERFWRDLELGQIMWLRERHRDQTELQAGTTLTQQQFSQLLQYIQALRDWPQSSEFPDSSKRPNAPLWIADQES